MSVMNALGRARDSSTPYYLRSEEVRLEMDDIKQVMVGEEVVVRVRVRNLNRFDSRRVHLALTAWTVHYTGVLAEKCCEGKYKLYIKPGEDEICKLVIGSSDYLDLLVDQCSFQCVARAWVTETDRVYCRQDTFRVLKPDVQIECDGTAYVGSPLTMYCSIKNPLDKTLHKATFILEGPGLESSRAVEISDIRRHDVGTCEITVSPKRSGRRTILVSFESRELDDVHSIQEIIVYPAN